MHSRGYEALRSQAAWLDLSARGLIAATGKDRARLLHALCSNQIKELHTGQGCYAFFLNPQGRILSDATIFCREQDFLLDTEPEMRASLRQHIKKYIIADDVTLEDAGDRLAILALEGPQALEIAARMGAPELPAENAHADWNGILAARVSFTGAPALRFYVPTERKAELATSLEAAGAIAADDEAARIVRLEHGQPRYSEDISDAYLIQETQQLQAVSFTKGCYLGQEIVERVRARGMVHRLLVGLTIQTREVPAAGAPVLQESNDVGKLTSAAWSPALERCVAMAYVRREQSAAGTQLTVNGATAEVQPLHRS